MNTVLKYPGSKWRIAQWIINHIPKHHSYVEPYFGSGAVLFNKAPSSIETVNDLDYDVVNLFRCIKENPEKLAGMVELTPYSRKEYDNSFEGGVPADKFDQAARFLIQCWQGHGFRQNGRKVGWKNDVQGREEMYACKNWYRLPGWIIDIVDRLRQVQIENRPAIEIIKRFRYPNVFIYADPPYLLDTRSGKQYKHEMTKQDHIELLEELLKHSGPVIISGYDNGLYGEMLKGWFKDSIGGEAEYYGKRKQEETIWMNYEPPKDNQISLF
jgi:DNA adenine methylase